MTTVGARWDLKTNIYNRKLHLLLINTFKVLGLWGQCSAILHAYNGSFMALCQESNKAITLQCESSRKYNIKPVQRVNVLGWGSRALLLQTWKTLCSYNSKLMGKENLDHVYSEISKCIVYARYVSQVYRYTGISQVFKSHFGPS